MLCREWNREGRLVASGGEGDARDLARLWLLKRALSVVDSFSPRLLTLSRRSYRHLVFIEEGSGQSKGQSGQSSQKRKWEGEPRGTEERLEEGAKEEENGNKSGQEGRLYSVELLKFTEERRQGWS
jgi:hypothetical protein